MKHLSMDAGLLFLRFFCGAGIAYHGYGKVFGGFMGRMTEGVAGMGFPMPEVFAWAAAISEFAGGLLLVAGLFSRPAAFFVFITMTVAAFVAHSADPFTQKELALAYWTMAGAIVLTGAGRFSIDGLIGKRASR